MHNEYLAHGLAGPRQDVVSTRDRGSIEGFKSQKRNLDGLEGARETLRETPSGIREGAVTVAPWGCVRLMKSRK